nr:uncharacterized protein LOC123771230 [Procambarus clarkii]
MAPTGVSMALPEVSPALPEVLPALPEVLPALPDVSPALPEVLPALPEVLPALPEVSPALPEVLPALPDVFVTPPGNSTVAVKVSATLLEISASSSKDSGAPSGVSTVPQKNNKEQMYLLTRLHRQNDGMKTYSRRVKIPTLPEKVILGAKKFAQCVSPAVVLVQCTPHQQSSQNSPSSQSKHSLPVQYSSIQHQSSQSFPVQYKSKHQHPPHGIPAQYPASHKQPKHHSSAHYLPPKHKPSRYIIPPQRGQHSARYYSRLQVLNRDNVQKQSHHQGPLHHQELHQQQYQGPLQQLQQQQHQVPQPQQHQVPQPQQHQVPQPQQQHQQQQHQGPQQQQQHQGPQQQQQHKGPQQQQQHKGPQQQQQHQGPQQHQPPQQQQHQPPQQQHQPPQQQHQPPQQQHQYQNLQQYKQNDVRVYVHPKRKRHFTCDSEESSHQQSSVQRVGNECQNDINPKSQPKPKKKNIKNNQKESNNFMHVSESVSDVSGFSNATSNMKTHYNVSTADSMLGKSSIDCRNPLTQLQNANIPQTLCIMCHTCGNRVERKNFLDHLFFGRLQCYLCCDTIVTCQRFKDKDFEGNCMKHPHGHHDFSKWLECPVTYLKHYIMESLTNFQLYGNVMGPPNWTNVILAITDYLNELNILGNFNPWMYAILQCEVDMDSLKLLVEPSLDTTKIKFSNEFSHTKQNTKITSRNKNKANQKSQEKCKNKTKLNNRTKTLASKYINNHPDCQAKRREESSSVMQQNTTDGPIKEPLVGESKCVKSQQPGKTFSDSYEEIELQKMQEKNKMVNDDSDIKFKEESRVMCNKEQSDIPLLHAREMLHQKIYKSQGMLHKEPCKSEVTRLQVACKSQILQDVNVAEKVSQSMVCKSSVIMQHEFVQSRDISQQVTCQSESISQLGNFQAQEPQVVLLAVNWPQLGAASEATPQLGADSEATPQLGADSEATPQLGADSEATPQLGADSEATPRLGADSEATPRLGADSEATPRLGADSEATPRLGADSEATPRLGADSVATPRLGADSVATPRLGADSVATPRLGADSVASPRLGADSVSSPQLGADLVAMPQLGADSEATPQLGANSVATPQLGADSEAMPQLGANSVATPQLGADIKLVSSQLESDLLVAPDNACTVSSEAAGIRVQNVSNLATTTEYSEDMRKSPSIVENPSAENSILYAVLQETLNIKVERTQCASEMVTAEMLIPAEESSFREKDKIKEHMETKKTGDGLTGIEVSLVKEEYSPSAVHLTEQICNKIFVDGIQLPMHLVDGNRFLVVRYPKEQLPEECPECYYSCASMFTYDWGIILKILVCPDCGLTIFITCDDALVKSQKC